MDLLSKLGVKKKPSKDKISDEIRAIEQDISARRESTDKLLQIKEAESVGLKMKLESAEKRFRDESGRKASGDGLFAGESKRRLDAISETSLAREKEWKGKTAGKVKELQKMKNEIDARQLKIKQEKEEKRQGYDSELADLIEHKMSLLDKQEREKETFASRLKAKEDEIVGIKTQLALKEAQFRSGTERQDVLIAETREKINRQLRTAEAKYEEKIREWQSEYRSRDNELIMFRAEIEQKESVLSMTLDEDVEKAQEKIQSFRDEIKTIEENVSYERERAQNAIKMLDDEFNKLKVENVLKETQEKSRQEKTQEVLQQEKAVIEKQLREIEREFEEDRNRHQNAVLSKENEIEALKVRSEIRLKEMESEKEQKQKTLLSEIEKLEKTKVSLKTKIKEEKSLCDGEIKAKNDEISKHRAELETGYAALRDKFSRDVESLNEEKTGIEKRLKEEKEKFNVEKRKWQDAIEEKEIELQKFIKENEIQEKGYNDSLKELDDSLKDKQESLIEKIQGLARRVEDGEEEYKRRKLQLDEVLKSYEKETSYYESNARKKHQADRKKIEQSKDALLKEIQNINGQINEIQDRAGNTLSLKQQEIDNIRSAIENALTLFEKGRAERHALADKEGKELNTRIAGLEEEVSRIQGRIEAVNKEEGKNKVLLQEKQAELRGKLQSQLNAIQGQWETEKAGLEKRISELRKKGEEEERATLSEIQEKERQLSGLKVEYAGQEENIKREQELLEQEVSRGKESLERAFKEKEKEVLSHKTMLESAMADYQKQIDETLALLKKADEECVLARAHKEDEISKERDKYTQQVSILLSDIETTRNAAGETISRLKEQIDEASAGWKSRREELQSRRIEIENEWLRTKEETENKISALELEYKNMELSLPALIAGKKKERASVQETLLKFEEERDRVVLELQQGLDSVRLRGEKRLEKAKREAEKEKSLLEQQVLEKQKEFEKETQRLQEEERTLLLNIDEESQRYAEERFELEKKRTELEDTMKDKQAETQEKLRLLDREILELNNNTIAGREEYRKDAVNIKADIAAQKSLVERELFAVSEQLNREGRGFEERMQEREKIFRTYKKQQDLRLKELLDKTYQQEKECGGNISALNEQCENLKRTYNEDSARRDVELKEKQSELEHAMSVFQEMETRHRDETERYKTEFENQKKEITAQILNTEEQLRQERDKFQGELNMLEGEFVNYQQEQKHKEEELTAAWLKKEAEMLTAKESLSAEIGILEKKLSADRNAWGRAREGIVSNIEKAKLKIAVRNTEIESERNRMLAGARKLQREAAAKLSDLKHRFDSEKETLEQKIRLKNEEINVLKLRLSGRMTMLSEERGRRETELKALVATFGMEMERLRTAVPGDKAEKKKQTAEMEQELSALKSDMEKVEGLLQEQKNRFAIKKDGLFEKFGQEFTKVEKTIEENMDKLRHLFEEKQKWVAGLHKEIVQTDNELRLEKEEAQASIAVLQQRARRIKEKMEGKGAEQSRASSLLDEGIRLFDSGRYAEATRVFSEIALYSPDVVFVYQYMAMSYEKLGLHKECREYAHKILGIDPDNAFAKNIILRSRK